MKNNFEKAKDLAKYMEVLRAIENHNKASVGQSNVDTQLSAANLKISDAIMHMDKAFNILMEE